MTMSKLDAREETRTLTVVLPESEWRALRSVEPDAIGWLQERIRERLGSSDAAGARSESGSGDSVRGYPRAEEF
jgi:hypothetical protein